MFDHDHNSHSSDTVVEVLPAITFELMYHEFWKKYGNLIIWSVYKGTALVALQIHPYCKLLKIQETILLISTNILCSSKFYFNFQARYNFVTRKRIERNLNLNNRIFNHEYLFVNWVKWGLCFDKGIRHIVFVWVCLSQNYGLTSLPIVRKFGVNVLGTKAEQRIR